MSVFSELLSFFPEYWDIDPKGRPALKMTYAGSACWVKIEDDKFEIIPQGGNGKRHTIQMDLMLTDIFTHIPYQMRLGDLASQINMWTSEGFHAEVIENSFKYFTDGTAHLPDLNNIWRQNPIIYTNYPYPPHDPPLQDVERNGLGRPTTIGWYLNEPPTNRPIMIPGFGNGMSDIGAVVLIDGMYNISENNVLQGATNLLWQLLKPIAHTLRKSKEYGEDLVRQIDLRAAEGPWLDRWGEVYGVKRVYPETDTEFRRRLSYTSFRPRINARSMENALMSGLGAIDVVMTDGIVPFKFHVRAIFSSKKTYYLGEPVKNVIESYRAAGTYYDIEEVILDKQDINRPNWGVRLLKQYVSGRIEERYTGDTFTRDILIPWHLVTEGDVSTGSDDWLVGGHEFGEQTVG